MLPKPGTEFGKLRRGAFAGSVLCAGLALLAIALLVRLVLPDTLFGDDYSRLMLDKDGEVIGVSLSPSQSWHFPAHGSLPPKYIKAVLCYEDRRFYTHGGIDAQAILRACLHNLQAGAIEQGASTITMQVARMGLRHAKRGILQKLQEAALALKLELQYSKDQLIELYASQAPFGGNVVGLEAASWRYFGRSPQQLSWAETATLAVLPNAPGLMHIERNRVLLKDKRDRLLQMLMAGGTLNPESGGLALREDLPPELAPMPRLAPHLMDSLLAGAFMDHSGAGIAGIWRTSLDSQLQKRILQLAADHMANLKANGIMNCAVLVIDNVSGQVLSYVGNNPSLAADTDGSWVDLVQRPRSTGSTLKPFLYAAMLDEGLVLPTRLVLDIPTRFPGFAPENSGRTFRGAIPAYLALARSLNVPAVRMLKEYGIEKFAAILKKTGMSTLQRNAEDYGLTLILGGAEGSLWELASMYSSLARRASDIDPANHPASPLLSGHPTGRPDAFSSGAAYLALKAMLEVNRPEGSGNSQERKIAWKTGTSQGYRDAWAIGVDARCTVGVWVGNADGEARPELGGTIAAGPLMFAVFEQLPASGWFQEPVDMLRTVNVCKYSGLPPGVHCDQLVQVAVPVDIHLPEPCPYCQTVTLTVNGAQRTSLALEGGSPVLHKSWFVLPPVPEWYYRQTNPDYRLLPPEKSGLQLDVAPDNMAIQYPEAGSQVLIPIDFGAAPAFFIAEVIHRKPGSKIFWHLDEQYLGWTSNFHTMCLQPEPGKHVLIVVDDKGETERCNFVVLSREDLAGR